MLIHQDTHHDLVLIPLMVGLDPGPGSDRVRRRRAKTRLSRRTLAPARWVDALRRQRAQPLVERLAAGSRWEESGLVFTTTAGPEMVAANVRLDLGRALALLPGPTPTAWTPRELRHSFVSVLSDAAVPLEEILAADRSTVRTLR